MNVDLRVLFSISYGRNPSDEEVTHVGKLCGDISNKSPAQAIRLMIGALPRQNFSTPFIVRCGVEDIEYYDIEGFQLALDASDCAVSICIKNDTVYEPHLTRFFKRVLRRGMSVVDVGANIGYFSLLASRLVGDGKVTAFEPNSENCRLILLSLERNGVTNVNLIPVALSTKAGSAFFSSHIGSNGGLLPSTTETLSDAQCIVVPTFRMDQLITERVDFIKIDVEGAEGIALTGATEIIDRYRPIVTSEFSPEMLWRVSNISAIDYLNSFKRRGYKVYILGRHSTDVVNGLSEIVDIERFMDGYGSVFRIEDIAFVPFERSI